MVLSTVSVQGDNHCFEPPRFVSDRSRHHPFLVAGQPLQQQIHTEQSATVDIALPLTKARIGFALGCQLPQVSG